LFYIYWPPVEPLARDHGDSGSIEPRLKSTGLRSEDLQIR